MTYWPRSIPVVALALLVGCDTMPEGPTVTALRGADKSFDEFRTDDVDCRQYAHAQVGRVTSASADHASGVTSAARGAAICAAVGAAIDGRGAAAAGNRTGSLIDG